MINPLLTVCQALVLENTCLMLSKDKHDTKLQSKFQEQNISLLDMLALGLQPLAMKSFGPEFLQSTPSMPCTPLP